MGTYIFKRHIVFFIRLVSIILGLTSVKYSIDAIGQINYGFWVSLLSILAWVSFVDGGVGNALRNSISHLKDFEEKTKVQHNSAYFVVSVNSLIVTILILLIMTIPVVSEGLSKEKFNTVIIASFLIVMQLPLKLIYSVRAGYGNYNILIYITTIAQLMNLLGIMIFIKFEYSRLDAFAFFSLLPGALILITYNVFCFLREDRRYFVKFQFKYRISRVSTNFLLLQLLAAITLNGATFVINSRTGSAEATAFFTYWKILFLPLSFYSIVLGNEWKKFSDAILHDSDKGILRSLLLRNVKIFFLFSSIVAILSMLSNWLLLVGKFDIIRLSFESIILICIWSILSLSGSLLSTLQNSINDVRTQNFTGIAMVFGLFMLWVTSDDIPLNSILLYFALSLLVSQLVQIYHIIRSGKYTLS